MGYEKEIILIKDAKSAEFGALDLLNIFRSTEWKETLAVIDRGDEFDWINAKNKLELDQILRDKTINKEFIGITLQNQKNKKFVTIHIEDERITFILDIGRNENELHWFNLYQEQLISKLKGIVERVEWRSNYDNEVIKIIDKKSM